MLYIPGSIAAWEEAQIAAAYAMAANDAERQMLFERDLLAAEARCWARWGIGQ